MVVIKLKYMLICVIVSFELTQQTSIVQNDEVLDARVPFGYCDTTVQTLIEAFRSVMLTGSEKWGIPKLSPYEIDHIGVDVTHEVGNATGFFKNFKIEQLHTFETTNTNCKLLTYRKFHVEINATVPTVNITGDYDLDGFVLEMIPMYGNGPFSVNITNLHIGIIANVSIMGVNKFKIQDLSLWLTMDETQMFFDNLLNGDEEYQPLFNKMFSEIGPQAVIDLWPDIEPILVRKVMKAVNGKNEKNSTF
ncbi:uncharacterized protein LOC123298196 isoform X2 [Chrysoperla carnea]|nr:uncharacterized protein LOC123298196 isoform X2 [Chrysoperla carnea]